MIFLVASAGSALQAERCVSSLSQVVRMYTGRPIRGTGGHKLVRKCKPIEIHLNPQNQDSTTKYSA